MAPIGDLDAATNPMFRDAVRAAAESARRLVVDLSQVVFMSAAALRIIARADVLLQRRSGELLVICPNPRVRQLFEISGLDSQLEIVASAS